MANSRRTIRPIRPIIPGREVDLELGGVVPDHEYIFDRLAHLSRVAAQLGATPALLFPPTTTAIDYTVIASDVSIRVDCSGGARTITMPATAGLALGTAYFIKKVDVTANGMTIDGNGTDTVEGAASVTTVIPGTSFLLFYIGGGAWEIN